MHGLAAFLYAAMIAWAPPSIHDYRAPRAKTEARYESISEDMTEIASVDAASNGPIFAGPTGIARMATLALAIDSFESGGFRDDVDTNVPSGDCKDIHGPHGTILGRHCNAVCLAQIWLRPGEKIENRKDCFRIELDRIRESWTSCQGLHFDEKLSVYASGNCEDGRKSSTIRVRRATAWWSEHPYLEPVASLDPAKMSEVAAIP